MPRSTQQARELAKKLRRNLTRPERYLWSRLNRQQLGVRFRPQVAKGEYVLDFYSHPTGLAIELDDHADNDRQQYDDARTKRLIEHFSVRKVIRFPADAVMHNIEGVVARIRAAMDELALESESAASVG